MSCLRPSGWPCARAYPARRWRCCARLHCFTTEQIGAIVGMIMATRLPQSPRTPLEQLLADADLDVLGRPDFLERNALLRAELAAYGAPVSDAEWYAGQLSFLRQHRYWTPMAEELRAAAKRQNIAALERILA